MGIKISELAFGNTLTSFDQSEGHEILSECQEQDYRSVYLDLYAGFRSTKESDKEQILDIVFEIELIKQVEINVDCILMLVAKMREAKGDGLDVEIRAQITRAVDSSPTLRNKKNLIQNFVDSVSATGEIDAEWRAFVDTRRTAELKQIIEDEKLKPEETRAFVESAFRGGVICMTGTAITKVMPATTRFSSDGAHGERSSASWRSYLRSLSAFLGLISANREEQ